MNIVEHFESVRILCLGDVMLDRFVNGVARRISPESPVPVLSVSKTESVAGGAANVARNIASLGGLCTLIGVIGNDSAGADLCCVLSDSGRLHFSSVATNERPTTEKVRFVAHGQHMLRSDSEDSSAVSTVIEDQILEMVRAHIHSHDALILSDYAKGVLTPRVVRESIRLANDCGVPTIVDPKCRDFARYDGAFLVTPNLHELWGATDTQGETDGAVAAAAAQLLNRTKINSILVTRSEKGMTLVRRDAEPVHIPTAAREVADVVGAGDTVIATLSLAIGAKADLVNAASIANSAAGIVVAKRGTATVSQSELLNAFRRSSEADGIGKKVMSVSQSIARAQSWKRSGLSVGFTNGCFDVLHAGHIGILEFSSAHCDRLIVGINADASVKRLKGPTRPLNTEEDRATLIAALSAVDLVVIFDEDTPEALINELGPDVLVKGADYQTSEIVGAASVLARGGQVLRFELVPGRSTTDIIRRARQNNLEIS